MIRLAPLAFEFAFLFLLVPLIICLRRIPNLPIAYLLLAALAAFFLLRADASYPPGSLLAWNGVRPLLLPLLFRDGVLLVFLGLAVWLFAPSLLFSFVKRAPLLWATVFVLYPFVSVFPQELLYRTFFFHRYLLLFGSGWGMVLFSALAFGYGHIVLRNRLAVLLSLLGGFLFASTYERSGSLLLTCVEHALFGNFLFTIGLGQFFYAAPCPGSRPPTILLPQKPRAR